MNLFHAPLCSPDQSLLHHLQWCCFQMCCYTSQNQSRWNLPKENSSQFFNQAVQFITFGAFLKTKLSFCQKHYVITEQEYICSLTICSIPGSISFSSSSTLLRVKSDGMYLGCCQNQKRLRLMTRDRSLRSSTSFSWDTGIRQPSGSISDTNLLVALANIFYMKKKGVQLCVQLENRITIYYYYSHHYHQCYNTIYTEKGQIKEKAAKHNMVCIKY